MGQLGQGRCTHRRQLCAQDIWHCLETLLVVTTRERGALGTEWVEARDNAQYQTVPRMALPWRLR